MLVCLRLIAHFQAFISPFSTFQVSTLTANRDLKGLPPPKPAGDLKGKVYTG